MISARESSKYKTIKTTIQMILNPNLFSER